MLRAESAEIGQRLKMQIFGNLDNRKVGIVEELFYDDYQRTVDVPQRTGSGGAAYGVGEVLGVMCSCSA